MYNAHYQFTPLINNNNIIWFLLPGIVDAVVEASHDLKVKTVPVYHETGENDGISEPQICNRGSCHYRRYINQ